MEKLGGLLSKKSRSETKSTFPVAGTVVSASLSIALLAFLTITLFMNDEFMTIFINPNLLDVLNFPFFGGVLFISILYTLRNRQKFLLKFATIVNFIILSAFGLLLIYTSGVYMEPWMSAIGQFYQLFPVFLGILLMTQTWVIGIHLVTLNAYLSSPHLAENASKISGIFVGCTLIFLNVFFWTFTDANLFGLAVIILAASTVEMSIWLLKDQINQGGPLQMNSNHAHRFIKILLIITLIYVGVYYSLGEVNQFFKIALAFPGYLGIVFIAHKSPEQSPQEEHHPSGIREEIKTHLKQKTNNTWTLGCFIFASVVLCYGCPPLQFLGPFIMFFSIGLFAGFILLGGIKSRRQHVYAEFCCGLFILVLNFILMYVDNVVNGYNYYSAEILEIWPFTYLGSPWQGLLSGIGFAFLFYLFYFQYKPKGNTFNFSVNTVGWILVLFFGIGLAVLLPNYNILTYGGDVALMTGPAPEVNAELYSDITVFIYKLAIPVLLVALFLIFSIKHWRFQRSLKQLNTPADHRGSGGEEK